MYKHTFTADICLSAGGRNALTEKEILSYDCVCLVCLVKGSFVTWAPAALPRSGTTHRHVQTEIDDIIPETHAVLLP